MCSAIRKTGLSFRANTNPTHSRSLCQYAISQRQQVAWITCCSFRGPSSHLQRARSIFNSRYNDGRRPEIIYLSKYIRYKHGKYSTASKSSSLQVWSIKSKCTYSAVVAIQGGASLTNLYTVRKKKLNSDTHFNSFMDFFSPNLCFFCGWFE